MCYITEVRQDTTSYPSNVNCVIPVELVINYRKLIVRYSRVGNLPCLDNWCPSVVIKGHEGGSKLRDRYPLSINTINSGMFIVRQMYTFIHY